VKGLAGKDDPELGGLLDALLAEAGFLVTLNLGEFPADACAPHDILAESPDVSSSRLVGDDPARQYGDRRDGVAASTTARDARRDHAAPGSLAPRIDPPAARGK